jgi:hypothetical protein
MSQVMIYFVYAMQIAIALGLLNVWIFRFNRKTVYRGSNAHNMKEEFTAYGLPMWFMYLVGFLKVGIALITIAVVIYPVLMYPVGFYALLLLSILMLGAVFMHIKVRDSLFKMVPAFVLLSMAVSIIYFNL